MTSESQPPKLQKHTAAEPMEGITAPPASPADANFSASKAVDKEAHGKGDKKPTHRPTPAHPAHPAPITPNSDGNSSRQAQTGSTKPVNRGKPATQSDATSKSTFDYTTGEVSVPLGASPQGVESDDERDEKDVAKLSESRQNEQGIEQRIKDQAVSHTACIKPEKAAGSMNCEPEQQSEFSRAPDQSDNLENILIGTAESKSAEHINEPVSEGRKESISALPQTETVDEAQSPSRKNETIIKGIMSSDDIGKESVLKQSSASNPDSTQHHPIQGGQGQIKDPISRNSEPTDVPLTNQEQRDTEEGDKEAGYTEIAKVHPSELEPKEEKDGSLLRSSAEKESSKVGRAGERSGNLRSRREDKPRQAMNSNICKSRELQEDPAEQKPIQSDVEEETAKHSDSSKVKKKRSTEALLTSASDQVPALESKDKEDEEKIPFGNETLDTEQFVSPIDLDSTEPQTKPTPNERQIKKEKVSENSWTRAEKSPANVSEENKTGKKMPEDVDMTGGVPPKAETILDQKSEAEDDNAMMTKKPLKSPRKATESHLSRVRSTNLGGAPDSSFDSKGKQDPLVKESGNAPPQMSSETVSQPHAANAVIPEDDGPHPVMGANGLAMRVGNAMFVTEDQLDEPKIARLNDKKVLPFERLTFKELRTYNRDQLRAYCFAYGMERRKKTEMEADMARYLSYWNRGKPGFALHEYVPTSGRVIDRDEFFGTRSSQANHSSASLGGASYSGVDVSRRMGSRMQSSYGDKGIIAGVQTHGNGSGILQTSLSTPSTGNGNRNAKTGSTATGLPRGFTTSFKQRVHARQASAKFKAAYNGAGDTIVNVVENAAAYFEGKDSPEVITDQTKSFERYQFNVDLLTEIFDGPIQEDVDILNVNLVKANGNLGETAGNNERCNNTTTTGAQGRTDVMLDIAKRLLSNKRNAHQAELDSFETNLKRAEEKAKHTERQNMRLFQKLERAETLEQVEAIKEEFEKEFGTPVDFNSRPIIRRKIDKTLPPLVIPDDQSRILRFTFL
eukprot:gb/GEZJ01001989.1/.p1 GENE.gb/GEZJ01001989.1/~~gb/GEZJ01001989.1/.p1  ORF type:complete len:1018 (+),score=181.11 gb/GEZJ01001989.1/:211-3264(+)